jgi:hypothetical protein
MSIYVNSCIALNDYSNNPCGTKEMGRVRALAFVKKTSTIADPTDDADWNALVTSGACILVPRVRGTYDGGVDVESAGFSDEATEFTGKNHQIQFFDPNFNANNRDFYNELRKASKDFKVWFVTETKLWEVETTPMISAKIPVTENVTDQVTFDVMIKWADDNLPLIYTKPASFFGN